MKKIYKKKDRERLHISPFLMETAPIIQKIYKKFFVLNVSLGCVMQLKS
jgi:hypothetical protein